MFNASSLALNNHMRGVMLLYYFCLVEIANYFTWNNAWTLDTSYIFTILPLKCLESWNSIHNFWSPVARLLLCIISLQRSATRSELPFNNTISDMFMHCHVFIVSIHVFKIMRTKFVKPQNLKNHGVAPSKHSTLKQLTIKVSFHLKKERQKKAFAKSAWAHKCDYECSIALTIMFPKCMLYNEVYEPNVLLSNSWCTLSHLVVIICTVACSSVTHFYHNFSCLHIYSHAHISQCQEISYRNKIAFVPTWAFSQIQMEWIDLSVCLLCLYCVDFSLVFIQINP